MKTIRISDEVWSVIAAQGKFGETEDIVLRRLLGVKEPKQTIALVGKVQSEPTNHSNKSYGWKERRAEVAMYQKIEHGKLVLEFETGQRSEWVLPDKNNAAGIRRVRNLAVEFVRKSGGTEGQVGAAMRALTSRGYHVTLKNTHRNEFV